MSKDKKKSKDKKAKSSKKRGSAAAAKTPRKAAKSLQALTQNPMVADVVAAALVAMASALKDSKTARRLASDAGDELGKMSKAGIEKGNALWDMALQIGRRSLETLTEDNAPKRAKSKAAAGKKSTRKTARTSNSR